MRLIAALTPRAPFQRLIVSEQKSLGREMFATGHYIKELAEAGVEIIEYRRRSLTHPEELHGQDAVHVSVECRRSRPRGRVQTTARSARSSSPGGPRRGWSRIWLCEPTCAKRHRPGRQSAPLPHRPGDQSGRSGGRYTHLHVVRRGMGIQADRKAAHSGRCTRTTSFQAQG